MPQLRRESRAPWITAGAVGVVLIALVAVYFAALVPAKGKVVGDLTSSEKAAMNAAAVEMVNLVSFRRAHFAADFQRAENGATGALRSDVQGKKAATQAAITQGKFDLSGKVTNQALVGPASSGSLRGYSVLVTINGYQSSNPDVPIQQDLQVTEVKVKGAWLASDVTNIGVS